MDAYAIETPEGHVVLRYPLAWEHMGAEYNAEISKRNLKLSELDKVLSGRHLRWLEPEAFEMNYDQVLAVLDRECNVPTSKKQILAHAA